MGEKTVDNLLAAIEKSKSQPLPRLINALGIRHVGEETAALLATRFGSLDNLMAASAEELEVIESIGPGFPRASPPSSDPEKPAHHQLTQGSRGGCSGR
jgi:NAD-dependent DNA ligase